MRGRWDRERGKGGGPRREPTRLRFHEHLTKTQVARTIPDVLEEPVKPDKARRLVREILDSGQVTFSGHALDALADDELSTVDAVNVLRAGVVDPAEFEKGCWRYRVRTRRIVMVIAFRSETEIRVVTAWREMR